MPVIDAMARREFVLLSPDGVGCGYYIDEVYPDLLGAIVP